MKFDIIDIGIVAAIFACTYYIWDEPRSYATDFSVEENRDEAGEFEGVANLELENTAHSARNCDACGSKGSVIVLEVTYSGLAPLTTEAANTLGDELLQGLFTVSSIITVCVYIAKRTLGLSSVTVASYS